MKKKFTLILTIVMILAGLTACASSKTDQTANENDLIGVGADLQLIIGTLLLDGTENEISTNEATELLPLWQLYSTLSNSDTAAEEEVRAVVSQIKSIMTGDQIAAIEKIDMTGQNALGIMKENGLLDRLSFDPVESIASKGELPEGYLKPQSGVGGGLGDFTKGGLPGGGIPGGKSGVGDGSGVDPSLMATKMAESGKTVPANRNAQIYLQLLISYLDNKATE